MTESEEAEINRNRVVYHHKFLHILLVNVVTVYRYSYVGLYKLLILLLRYHPDLVSMLFQF